MGPPGVLKGEEAREEEGEEEEEEEEGGVLRMVAQGDTGESRYTWDPC